MYEQLGFSYWCIVFFIGVFQRISSKKCLFTEGQLYRKKFLTTEILLLRIRTAVTKPSYSIANFIYEQIWGGDVQTLLPVWNVLGLDFSRVPALWSELQWMYQPCHPLHSLRYRTSSTSTTMHKSLPSTSLSGLCAERLPVVGQIFYSGRFPNNIVGASRGACHSSFCHSRISHSGMTVRLKTLCRSKHFLATYVYSSPSITNSKLNISRCLNS